MEKFIVTLTGGIGSGKTTVGNLFKSKGIEIVDTDEIAHSLTVPGISTFEQIVETFGKSIVSKDGSLDRGKLREIVFTDVRLKEKLEGILHPAISAISKARCEAVKSSYGILVVPLLFETTGHKQAKRILVVDCEPQTQISRVVARSNITPKDVKAIMATQVDRKIRIAGADDIITNSGDLENLELQSSKLHEKYEKIAQLAQKSSKDKK